MQRRWFIYTAVLVLSSLASAGYSFDEVIVEYWAGSGSNESMLVLDFGDDSYAFGYRWDTAAPSSYHALEAIRAGGLMEMSSHYDEGQAGWFVDSLSYGGLTMSSMAFFTATDGTDWATSWDGASDRVLSNGAWDGWAAGEWVEVSPDWWEFSGIPTTPVPEPSLLALLSGGALILRKRK